MDVEKNNKNITLKRIIDDIPSLLEKVGKAEIIIGILFCPDNKIGLSEQFINSFEDLNINSNVNSHFYLPGWKVLNKDNSGKKSYDAPSMCNFKQTLNAKTNSWQSNNGLELLLMDGLLDSKGRGKLNFSSVIYLRFNKINALSCIEDINEFMSIIFQFAEDYNGQQPTRNLSNHFLKKNVVASVRILFEKMNFRTAAGSLVCIPNFATHDFSRKSEGYDS